MLHPAFNLLKLVLISLLFSCNSIKKRGDQTLKRTKEELIEKKDYLVDRVFPVYDDSIPDTENNRKRFKEHLQIKLTDDVHNIYSYGDYLGADYKVLIAFTCNQMTIDAIVKTKRMQLAASKNEDGLFFTNEFKWWNTEKIKLITPYKVGVENEYWQYLWYDTKTGHAFYQEFSL